MEEEEKARWGRNKCHLFVSEGKESCVRRLVVRRDSNAKRRHVLVAKKDEE